MNDYELLYMIRQGDQDALDLLLEKYKRFRWSIVHHACYNPNALRLELEDLYQEATIGFLTAAHRFDEEMNVLFSVFAYHCCLHQVRLFIRRNRGMAYQLLNNAMSLDYPASSVVSEGGGNLEEIIEDSNPDLDPAQMAHYFETKEAMVELLNELSTLEKQVFILRNQGHAYVEIARLVESTPKKVDNILQKIRRLAKQRIDF